MKNAELMNKVMTEDELDIVAGGGPRVRVPLRSPSFKQLKDVTGAIHNAKKMITCLIKKFKALFIFFIIIKGYIKKS